MTGGQAATLLQKNYSLRYPARLRSGKVRFETEHIPTFAMRAKRKCFDEAHGVF